MPADNVALVPKWKQKPQMIGTKCCDFIVTFSVTLCHYLI